MKKILALVLVFLVLMSTAAFAAEFVDMPEEGHWARTAIENAVKNGLLTGSGNYVNPDDNMTRAQMATIMVRACGATADADISAFTDVATDDWFYASMSKAVAMGAFNGSGGKLNPDSSITRQEAFVVLSRVFGLTVSEEIDTSVLNQFKDSDKVADWARTDVAAIIASGYVGGANGMINPEANITRAEFAVVMDRLVKYYIDDPETTTIPSDGNVMIREAGIKLDGISTDKMVVIGDGVGIDEISISNAKLTGPMIVRGGADVILDGEYRDVKIIMPNIRLQCKPAAPDDPNGIHAIYIEKGSTWSMGILQMGGAADNSANTVIDAVDEITE